MVDFFTKHSNMTYTAVEKDSPVLYNYNGWQHFCKNRQLNYILYVFAPISQNS